MCMREIKDMLTDFLPSKAPSTSVHFPKDITFYRAFIYSLVCGTNSNEITKEQFLAGCNRFGIDNPCPIITKRLSNYGNAEELVKDFEILVEKYQAIVPEANLDPDLIAPAELRALDAFDGLTKKTFRDLNETR